MTLELHCQHEYITMCATVPMLELRLLLGLTIVTMGKNTLSCEYNSVVSLPRKIFATNVPPGRNKCVVKLSACDEVNTRIEDRVNNLQQATIELEHIHRCHACR